MSVQGRRVITAGHIRVGGGARVGGIVDNDGGDASAENSTASFSFSTYTSTYGLVGVYDEKQGRIVKTNKQDYNPMASTPSGRRNLPHASDPNSTPQLEQQPAERYQPAPLTTSKPNYQPTDSEVKKARKAPLLRRKQYGEDLRHKNRRKYLLRERNNVHREGAQVGAARLFVESVANENDSEYNNRSYQDDENNMVDNEEMVAQQVLSEEDKAQQNELVRLNMKRRSAQALQKLRLDRTKREAEESLAKAKRRRMEEMAKLIRQANRKDAEQSRLSKSITTSVAATGTGTDRTAAAAAVSKTVKVVAVSDDVVVRVSTSWSGIDVGSLARDLSQSSDVSQSTGGVDPSGMSAWSTSGMTTSHRPAVPASALLPLDEMHELPPRKPRVPRLSSGISKKKKSSKGKSKKRKKRKRKKNEQQEAPPKLVRKPAVPRLSGRALSNMDTNVPDTTATESVQKNGTKTSVTKATTVVEKQEKQDQQPPSNSNNNKDSYAELQARREGAKVYIAQQREKRYQARIRERMTRDLEEKRRIDSLRSLDEQSRYVIKRRARAAALVAAEAAATKRRKRKKKSTTTSSRTHSANTAHARAVTQARKDLSKRLNLEKKKEDPYEWYTIRTPEAIIAENALQLGSDLPTDLSIPEVRSPMRRAGLSSEEEEEEDIDLNQQAFLQGIGSAEVELDKEEEEKDDDEGVLTGEEDEYGEEYDDHYGDERDAEEEELSSHGFEEEDRRRITSTFGDETSQLAWERGASGGSVSMSAHIHGSMENEETTILTNEDARLLALRKEADELTERIRSMKSKQGEQQQGEQQQGEQQQGEQQQRQSKKKRAWPEQKDDVEISSSSLPSPSHATPAATTPASAPMPSIAGIGVASISKITQERHQRPPTPRRDASAPADYPVRTPKVVQKSVAATTTVQHQREMQREGKNITTESPRTPSQVYAKKMKATTNATDNGGEGGEFKNKNGVDSAVEELVQQDKAFEAALSMARTRRMLDEETALVDESEYWMRRNREGSTGDNNSENNQESQKGEEKGEEKEHSKRIRSTIETVENPSVDLLLAAEAAMAVSRATESARLALQHGREIEAQSRAYEHQANAILGTHLSQQQSVLRQHEKRGNNSRDTMSLVVNNYALPRNQQQEHLGILGIFEQQMVDEKAKVDMRAIVTLPVDTPLHHEEIAGLQEARRLLREVDQEKKGERNDEKQVDSRDLSQSDDHIHLSTQNEQKHTEAAITKTATHYHNSPNTRTHHQKPADADAKEEENSRKERKTYSTATSTSPVTQQHSNDMGAGDPEVTSRGVPANAGPVSGGGRPLRLSPESLAQRLLAEVDRLENLRVSEEQLSQMEHLQEMHRAELIMAKKTEAWAHQQEQMVRFVLSIHLIPTLFFVFLFFVFLL
jgi:hypothetical protein